MRALGVEERDGRTPTEPRNARFCIPGILGLDALFKFMR
jgi:hypothetical protein